MVQNNCPVLWIVYAPTGFCRLIVKEQKKKEKALLNYLYSKKTFFIFLGIDVTQLKSPFINRILQILNYSNAKQTRFQSSTEKITEVKQEGGRAQLAPRVGVGVEGDDVPLWSPLAVPSRGWQDWTPQAFGVVQRCCQCNISQPTRDAEGVWCHWDLSGPCLRYIFGPHSALNDFAEAESVCCTLMQIKWHPLNYLSTFQRGSLVHKCNVKLFTGSFVRNCGKKKKKVLTTNLKESILLEGV